MRARITMQRTVSPDSLGLVQQAPANPKSTRVTVDCKESYQRTLFSAFKHQILYVLGELIVQRKQKTGEQPILSYQALNYFRHEFFFYRLWPD